jgi:hypothetical protein
LSIHQVTTLAKNKDEKKDHPLDFSIGKKEESHLEILDATVYVEANQAMPSQLKRNRLKTKKK